MRDEDKTREDSESDEPHGEVWPRRHLKELLGKTFNSLKDALFVVDPVTRKIIDCNPAAEQIFGYDRDEMLGRSTAFLHVDRMAFERFAKHLFPALETEGVYRTEFTLRRRNGEVFPSDHTVTEVIDESGNRTAVVSLVRDISERHRTERDLRTWARMFEHAHWGIATSEDGETIQRCNAAYARMHGYSIEGMQGRPFTDYVPREARPAFLDQLRRADERGHHAFESRGLRRDGGVFPALIDVAVVTDDQGQRLYQVAQVRDLTEFKQTEAELSRQAGELSELNAALKVLLRQREEEQQEMNERVRHNVKKLIEPHLMELRQSRLDAAQIALVDLVARRLQELTSPLGRTLADLEPGLTPREIQVASHVLNGRTSKEIAALLHISSRAVEAHRLSLRRKLGLKSRRVNLRSYLMSLTEVHR